MKNNNFEMMKLIASKIALISALLTNIWLRRYFLIDKDIQHTTQTNAKYV